jgi:ornithine decarboxylase
MKNLAYDLGNGHHPHPFPYKDTRDFLASNRADKPYFLFSRNELRQNAQVFQRLFPGEVSFAVKANPDPLVLATLYQSGIQSFDVASLGEIEQLSRLFPESTLHFNNPVRTPEVTRIAYFQYGVRSFVVDDRAGLKQLRTQCGSQMEISVRFKLEHDSAAYDFGSKFGADKDDSVILLRRAAAMGAKTSLTFHPGSQCTDPAVYARYVEAAAEIASMAGVTLYRLNVGGGFPVAYPGSEIDSVEEFFRVIGNSVEQHFADNRPELLCEPGRALAASCASLLTRVIHVRENGDVFVNDGIYGSLQEQAIMKTELPIKAWRGDQPLESGTVRRRIFGPTCDPVDRLSTSFSLPVDLEPGDYLEFGLMGAYGSATATRFNGFEPAQYITVNTGYSQSRR